MPTPHRPHDATSALTGHQWQPPDGLTPALLWAMAREQASRPGVSTCHYPVWAIDQVLTHGTRYRLTGESGWMIREPQTIHCYPPNTCYDELDPPKAKIRSQFLLIRGLEVLPFFRTLAQQQKPLFVPNPPRHLQHPIAACIALGQTRGDSGLACAQSALWHLIDGLQQAGNASALAPTTGPGDGLVPRLDRYLRRNLAEPLTLAHLAEHLQIAPSTLSHRYRQATGHAPMARLTALRVDAARPLIAQGLPLREVAQTTGFCDAFHLSRVFRKLTGQSPKTYRQQVLSDPGKTSAVNPTAG